MICNIKIGSFLFPRTNQVEIQPAERETIFSDELRPSDPRNVGPCGGFSTQYACMCDYHGVPYRLVLHHFFVFSLRNILIIAHTKVMSSDVRTIIEFVIL